jgi:hypothetical protein
LLTQALVADPVVTEKRTFDPRVNWLENPMTDEPWWQAFMASVAPYLLSYEEWARCHSSAFLQEYEMNEDAFKRSARLMRNTQNMRNTEIDRISAIRYEGSEYLAVVELVSKPTGPLSAGGYRTTILKKVDERWINCALPTDISFDSPILKLNH